MRVRLRRRRFGQLGALARMSDAAANEIIRDRYLVISEALVLSASAQLRNMASIGGNLMQRTRCTYFRDTAFPCNKRTLGEGCPAIQGEHQMHAILGTSQQCFSMHPSDLAVALVALAQSAHARLLTDGRAVIQCLGTDIGTGTYTILAQVAAEVLGLLPDHIQVEIGDSSLPGVAISGGSMTAAALSSAVHIAASNLRRNAIELAVAPHINVLGVKGVGELGMVGVNAAVANAIYHAIGKRISDLPITPEKLL